MHRRFHHYTGMANFFTIRAIGAKQAGAVFLRAIASGREACARESPELPLALAAHSENPVQGAGGSFLISILRIASSVRSAFLSGLTWKIMRPVEFLSFGSGSVYFSVSTPSTRMRRVGP